MIISITCNYLENYISLQGLILGWGSLEAEKILRFKKIKLEVNLISVTMTFPEKSGGNGKVLNS